MENKIKEVRKSKNITQEQLAYMLGLTRSVISKYESGLIVPSMEQYFKLAMVLGVSLYELVPNDILDAYFYGFGRSFALNAPSEAESNLIYVFNQLNDEGQRIAVERVEELTEIPKYQKTEKDEPESEDEPESKD